MLPRHNQNARARSRLSLALSCALALAALSALPLAPRNVAAQGGGQGEIQSAQIPSVPAGQAYRQTNFLSDVPGLALSLDPLLVNPWGISMTATSPFWIVNNGTSTTQLVRGDVGGTPLFLNANPQTVTIPGNGPTGTVANTTSEFVVTSECLVPPCPSGPARFIFASVTGNITGWNPNVPAAGSTLAQVAVRTPGHVWTGLAIGSNSGGNRLYAADFAQNHIDVFTGSFAATTVTGGFADPTVPADHHPFNIQNIGGSLYVTYAKVGADGRSASGAGLGYVRKFSTDGVRDPAFAVNNGALNAPWGLALAPASFGTFGGALLVGNFGEGGPSINAYNASTGAFLGSLQNEAGEPIEIDELWAITFGNGGAGGDPAALYFSAGPGEEEHGLFGSLRPTTATATSLIQFAADEFTIGEGDGSILLTVTRSGNVTGAATVNYSTFDETQAGHANQKSDYEIGVGTLRFAPGETSKTFRLPLVDDRFVEGDETVEIFLSNPTGAGVGLGSPDSAEVTITDNDTAPTTANPIDNPQFFVRQHYLDFLNREPDPAGFNAWLSTLANCQTGNTTCDRVSVSAAFFGSPEFKARGYFATRFYRAAFGRDPLYGEFVRDLSLLGGSTPEETNSLNALFPAEFVQRPEFVSRYGSLSNAQFVDNVLSNLSAVGVTFPAATRDQWVADLNAGTKTRAQVLREIVEAPQFVNNTGVFNRAFVLAEYFGYLRRDPDPGGFNNWLTFMNANPNNFRTMVNGFVNSTEYRRRFGAS